MADLSTRLKLTLPTGLEDMSLGDNILSDAWDKIDKNCHCRIVPNLDSIINPFEGMHVYSEAEDKNFIRRNNTFVPVSGSGTGGGPTNPGVVGYKASALRTTSFNLSNTQQNFLSATFQSVASHTYLVALNVSHNYTTANFGDPVAFCSVRHASGTSTTSSSTSACSFNLNRNGQTDSVGPSTSFITFLTTSVTGNYTVALWGYMKDTGDVITVSNDGTITSMVIYDVTEVP